ncbi:hypothetical protein [uncultured Nostoc sp.]|uniref:hypothetical protein n=1 Tax=uncultured Nostoc sp. TaxID=340711 RepID=UPI0035C9C567
MNIRRVLVVTAIPLLVSTFGFISLNQANAASKFSQIAQAQLPPNRPPDGQQRPPRPDFKAAAAKLGVTETQLKNALGVPANPPNPGDRNQRPPRPDFKAAAAKLGVTEQQLKDALGVPPHPPGVDRSNPPK